MPSGNSWEQQKIDDTKLIQTTNSENKITEIPIIIGVQNNNGEYPVEENYTLKVEKISDDIEIKKITATSTDSTGNETTITATPVSLSKYEVVVEENTNISVVNVLANSEYTSISIDGLIYEQDVLAIPEVKKYSLDDVDFIVMGSDGFWDYGDSIQTICDNIYNELKKNPKKDLCDLIGNIFDKGLAKANNYLRGTDNMSCIIIQFMK